MPLMSLKEGVDYEAERGDIYLLAFVHLIIQIACFMPT